MTLAIEAFRCGPMDNGVYALYDAALGVAVIVDPSFESDRAVQTVIQRGLRLEAIVNTHGHFDHVVGNAQLRELAPDAALYLHPADLPLLRGASEQGGFFGLRVPPSPEPDHFFEEGVSVTLAGQEWQVLHVPGHSPGSVCLYSTGVLIGGDVLFRGSIGRTDLPEGDHDLLLQGLHEKILALPDETIVYPGHGAITSIGWERRSNPFLR